MSSSFSFASFPPSEYNFTQTLDFLVRIELAWRMKMIMSSALLKAIDDYFRVHNRSRASFKRFQFQMRMFQNRFDFPLAQANAIQELHSSSSASTNDSSSVRE